MRKVNSLIINVERDLEREQGRGRERESVCCRRNDKTETRSNTGTESEI